MLPTRAPSTSRPCSIWRRSLQLSKATPRSRWRVASPRNAGPLWRRRSAAVSGESIADGIHMKEAAQALADVESDAKRASPWSCPRHIQPCCVGDHIRKVDAEAMRLR